MLNVLNHVTDFMFIYYIDEKLKFLINLRLILTKDFEINFTFFLSIKCELKILFNYF